MANRYARMRRSTVMNEIYTYASHAPLSCISVARHFNSTYIYADKDAKQEAGTAGGSTWFRRLGCRDGGVHLDFGHHC